MLWEELSSALSVGNDFVISEILSLTFSLLCDVFKECIWATIPLLR